MKDKEHLKQEVPGPGKEQANESQPITSESIKNAHAAGDGAMERSSDSIPDEEELKSTDQNRTRRTEQY